MLTHVYIMLERTAAESPVVTE